MSQIRKKEKRNKKRSGLNTSGRNGGPARNGSIRHGGFGRQFLTKEHDLKSADPDCRICHGAGATPSAYMADGKARMLACSCLP